MIRGEWTVPDMLGALMRLPWTLHVEKDDEGDLLAASVREVPDAIATGRTDKALAIDLWESLRASLLVRLEHGDPIPLPEGCTLPWAAGIGSIRDR